MKSLLRKWMFFEPLPFVKRVVYIATPFRGSFRAQGWVRRIIQRIVSLPLSILSLPVDIAKKDPNIVSELLGQTKLPFEFRNKMPASIHSMSPPKSGSADPCEDAGCFRSQGAFDHCHRRR